MQNTDCRKSTNTISCSTSPDDSQDFWKKSTLNSIGIDLISKPPLLESPKAILCSGLQETIVDPSKSVACGDICSDERRKSWNYKSKTSLSNPESAILNPVESDECRAKRSKMRPAKPPYSYIALIAMAIQESPTGMATLADINDFLRRKFAFFRGDYTGWRNSVRHNLSLNDCFRKVLRDPTRPWAKDNYWMLNQTEDFVFADGLFQRRRKRTRSSSSNTRSQRPMATSNAVPNNSQKLCSSFSIDSLLRPATSSGIRLPPSVPPPSSVSALLEPRDVFGTANCLQANSCNDLCYAWNCCLFRPALLLPNMLDMYMTSHQQNPFLPQSVEVPVAQSIDTPSSLVPYFGTKRH